MKKYRKREKNQVTAVCLNLDTDGFTYKKWGDTQSCKAGDWLVSNGNDTYTVDAESFALTYTPQSPGVYLKTAIVYAACQKEPGRVKTKEGVTHYNAGDYLVYNDASCTDGYAINAQEFEELYELVDAD